MSGSEITINYGGISAAAQRLMGLKSALATGGCGSFSGSSCGQSIEAIRNAQAVIDASKQHLSLLIDAAASALSACGNTFYTVDTKLGAEFSIKEGYGGDR